MKQQKKITWTPDSHLFRCADTMLIYQRANMKAIPLRMWTQSFSEAPKKNKRRNTLRNYIKIVFDQKQKSRRRIKANLHVMREESTFCPEIPLSARAIYKVEIQFLSLSSAAPNNMALILQHPFLPNDTSIQNDYYIKDTKPKSGRKNRGKEKLKNQTLFCIELGKSSASSV